MSDTLKMIGKQEFVDLRCNHTFSGMHSASFEFNSSEIEEKTFRHDKGNVEVDFQYGSHVIRAVSRRMRFEFSFNWQRHRG